MTKHRVDEEVARLARRQHGVFSRRQAARLGATPDNIVTRVRSGRWLQLDHSVFALPGNPPTWERQLMAAQLGLARSAVSGLAAASLHRLGDARPGRPELSVPRGGAHKSRLATVRQVAHLEICTIDGIATTTAAQTLFDIAGRVPLARLMRTTDDALVRKLVSAAQLRAWNERLATSRRPGLAAMRSLAAVRIDGYVPSESELEVLLFGMLTAPGIPVPVRQAPLPWRPSAPQRLDGLLVDWRVIVEADGRLWHTRVEDFARDRQRDRQAAAHGYQVLRYTWEELRHEVTQLRDELRAIGAARQAAA
ncbi:type IV toxin-antitoxin system AbiEi family antitoxin domain-containing protein [soil metagenome]